MRFRVYSRYMTTQSPRPPTTKTLRPTGKERHTRALRYNELTEGQKLLEQEELIRALRPGQLPPERR